MYAIIRRGLSMLDPAMKRRLPWMLLSVMLLAVMETVGIAIIFPVILLLVDPSAILSKPLVKSAYQFSEFAEPRDFALALVAIMIGALTLKNIASIAIYRWQFRVMQAEAAEFANRLFERYLRMPYLNSLTRDLSFFSYVINAVGSIICSTFVYQVLLIASETMVVATLFMTLMYTGPTAALSALAVLGAAGALIYFVTAPQMTRIGDENRKASEQTLRLINETFGNFKEIRVLGRGGRFLSLYRAENRNLAANQAAQMFYATSTRYLMEIAMLASISVFVTITLSGQNLAASIGVLSLFGASALRILPSVARILSAMQAVRGLDSSIRLAEDEAAQFQTWVLEPPGAIDAPPPSGDRVPVLLQLEDIGFSYTETLEPAVARVNLTIPFGESLGVVGPSGSGKTTVADIILGVITPDAGRVLADGVDIQADLIAWRRRVAYVPQQIAFVSGTIRSNVALGLLESEINDNRVRGAIEAAQLGPLIAKLPLGLNSPIGEAGKLLSGGERQRLGIARALYQNASVLVLDEATSALDVETEDRFTTLLHGLSGICTTIIIAHRLRTIRACDRIALFAAGELIAVDDFEGLSIKQPRFARLVALSNVTAADELLHDAGRNAARSAIDIS
jgi:ABC-type multidrug transport system fused ATPase/permease subunit